MMQTKVLKTNSFMSYFIPFFMILAQYPIFSTFTFGIFVIMMYSFLYYLTVNDKIYVHKYLLYLTLYITLMEVFDMVRGGFVRDGQINSILMMYIWLFVVSVSSSIIDIKKMYKVFSIIGIVSIVVIFYQSVFIYGLHQPMKPIAILPIPSTRSFVWEAAMRPAAFFTEPAAYVSYMLPLLFLSINFKKYIFSLFIIISILLSGSSSGIIFLAIYALYSTFFMIKGVSKKFLLLIGLILVTYLFFTVGIFDSAIKKIATTDFEHQIRVAKGFLIYYEMNLQEKLFGIVGSVGHYILANLHSFPWANIYIIDHKIHLLDYITSFSGEMVKSGIFASFLYIVMFYKMFKYDDISSRGMLLLIIISTFISSFSYNSWFAYSYIMYFVMINPKINKNFIILKYGDKNEK